jgi:hypothetical protein
MDQLFRISLRLWLTITSLIAFLFGWVLLAHAQKPAPLVQSQSQAASSSTSSATVNMPQLAPIPSLQQLQKSPQTITNVAPIAPAPSISFNFPVMRTRGS